MDKKKGFFALFTSGILYGVTAVLIRILNQQLTSFQQIAIRSFIGFIFAIAICVVIKSKWKFPKGAKRYILLFALSFPISIVFFTLSILQTKIADTVFSFYIGSILFSLLIGHYFFKEKITISKIVSVILVFIGLLFFTFPLSKTTINLGFIFGLISGLADPITNSFRKHLGGKADKFILSAIQMLGCLFIASILMLVSKQIFIPNISVDMLITCIIYGVIFMFLSYFPLVGFQNFDLNLGTIVISSELFFAPLFAFIVFRERLTYAELIGGVFIGLAIVIPHLPKRR